MVFKKNGDFTFTCFAHDSGFDNIDYVLSVVILTPDGIAFTFQHTGGVEGTIAGLPFSTPRRDDSFTGSGNNSSITNEWALVPGSFMTANVAGMDATAAGIEKFWGMLLTQLSSRRFKRSGRQQPRLSLL